MQKLLVTAGRISSPLILILLLLLSLDRAASQFGVTTTSLQATLSRFGWLYLSLAAAGLILTAVGLIHEAFAPPNAKGPLGSALNRLTNRPALDTAAFKPVVIDAEALAARLKAKVIGQDTVCDDLATQIRRRLALEHRGRPIGVFLLAGPPGTGKSYLARRLAIELNRKLLALDMAQFAKPDGASMLFGAPKGYIGSEVYGALTAALQATPNLVILLDEIEKAHPEVHKRFLTAWNDGYVTEASDGRQISTTQAIFILTSNAATDALTDIYNRNAGDPDEIRRASIDVLRQAGFASEVLNRLDRFFVFHALTGPDVARVATLEIEAMIENYGLRLAEGGIDPALLSSLTQRQQRMGAAASARDLARSIEETISDSLIAAKQRSATKVALIANGDRIVAEIAD